MHRNTSGWWWCREQDCVDQQRTTLLSSWAERQRTDQPSTQPRVRTCDKWLLPSYCPFVLRIWPLGQKWKKCRRNFNINHILRENYQPMEMITSSSCCWVFWNCSVLVFNQRTLSDTSVLFPNRTGISAFQRKIARNLEGLLRRSKKTVAGGSCVESRGNIHMVWCMTVWFRLETQYNLYSGKQNPWNQHPGIH